MTTHILVVEDSELVTSAFRILLEDAGYRVSIASTLASAVETAGRDRVDVMLLDLALPDGKGLDALPRLGEKKMLPRVTLAMTGDDEPETRRRCVRAGCADVLIKPVSIKKLLQTITKLLD